MTDAVIYARVSSKEQSEGYSIDAQLRLLRDYADENEFDVVQEFLEVETARKTGRVLFQEMLGFLKDSPECAVLVEKTDRLYRNIKDWVTVDELEIDIHFVKEGMIIGPAAKSSDKFFHGIRVLMAKNYCENLSEEARKGLTEKIRQGGWCHKAPFGYRNVKGPESAEPVPEEAEVMQWMYERMARGDVSVKEMYRQYKEGGFSAYIPLSKVYLKLRDPFYKGMMKWKGDIYQGNHLPIVDDETWETVQAILDINGRQPKRQVTDDFLYRGLITCGHCGCSIVPEKKKGRYIYYHCSEKRGSCKENGWLREEVLTEQFINYLRTFVLDDVTHARLVDTIRQQHQLLAGEVDESVTSLNQRSSKIRNKRNKIYQDKLDGNIKDYYWREQHARLSAELRGINSQLRKIDNTDLQFYILAEQILDLCKQAPELFERGNSEMKNQLLKLVVRTSTLSSGTLINSGLEPFSLLQKGSKKTMVGEERFELSASCSQSRRANRTAPLPDAS